MQLIAIILTLLTSLVFGGDESIKGCFIPAIRIHIKVGERFPLNGLCQVQECQPDHTLLTLGCPAFIVPANSLVKQDLNKRYPACCPTYELPKLPKNYNKLA